MSKIRLLGCSWHSNLEAKRKDFLCQRGNKRYIKSRPLRAACLQHTFNPVNHIRNGTVVPIKRNTPRFVIHLNVSLQPRRLSQSAAAGRKKNV